MPSTSLALVLAVGGPGLDVSWTAPDRCPGVEAVRQAIEDNLAREDFGTALDEVRVSGEVTAQPQGWQLTVKVALPTGSVERELTAASCDVLAPAAGLIIAVALDPLRVQQVYEERVTTPSPQPSPQGLPRAWVDPPRPEPQPEAAPQPEAQPPHEPAPLNYELRLGAMGGYGSLPVIRGGAQAGFGLVGSWFRADFGLLYWAPRAVRPFSASPRAGVRLQQAGISGRACLSPRIGSVTPSTCAGVETGLAWGRGVGIETPATTTLPWFSATTGLEVAWLYRERIGVFAGLDALFNAVRPSIQIDGVGEDVQIRTIGVRALVGLAIRFSRNSSDATP